MQASAEAMENFGLYAGIDNVESALQNAMRYWNSFWGPLGAQHITKKTLIDNRDLVFTLVAATSESLIRERIQATEEGAHLRMMLGLQRNMLLSTFQHLVSIYNAELVRFDLRDDLAEDVRPLDDIDGFTKAKNLPKWVLMVDLPSGSRPMLVISHQEYVNKFNTVKIVGEGIANDDGLDDDN